MLAASYPLLLLVAASLPSGSAGFAPPNLASPPLGSTSRTPRRPGVLPLGSTELDEAPPAPGLDDGPAPELVEVLVRSKPLGMVLESNDASDASSGVYCLDVPRDSAAYEAGARDGDLVVAIAGEDATSLSLQGAMARIGAAEAPVSLGLERYPDGGFVLGEEAMDDAERERELKRLLAGKGLSGSDGKARMAPRRLPSAKKLLRASTNVRFWQDPLMIGSAVFTVAAPLGIWLAAQGGS